jgi:3-methyladenine DNA glycosylase AlkD
MNVAEVINELEGLGSEGTKKVLRNHGAREPFFGVKIGDMKKIQKRIKVDYQLALDLFDTGNYDAMYLAGLIADDARMTKEDLQRWVTKAYCVPIAGSAVAWVAAGSQHGHDLALEWIESKDALTAATGWAVLSSLVSIKDDAELDLAELKRLLQRVQKTIHLAANAVRYQMNCFVIAAGSYVRSLTALAIETGEKIGKVSVNMGNNSCVAFYSPDYIRKVEKHGTLGKKRKSAKC